MLGSYRWIMVSSFALSSLPVVRPPSTGAREYSIGDGDFAAVVFGMEQGATPAKTKEKALIPNGTELDSPALAEPQDAGVEGGDLAPKLPVEERSDQVVAATAGLVPPPMWFMAEPGSPHPVVQTQTDKPQLWSTAPAVPTSLAPAASDLTEAKNPIAASSLRLGAAKPGENGRAEPWASARMTEVDSEPFGVAAAPLEPKPVPPVAFGPAPVSRQATDPLTTALMSGGPSDSASPTPPQTAPVSALPARPNAAETAGRADFPAVASPQIAPYPPPMREGAAVMAAVPFASQQVESPEIQAPPWTGLMTATRLMPSESPQPADLVAAPVAAGVPNSISHMGVARDKALDTSETPTETSRPPEATLATAPLGLGAEALRPLAANGAGLDRPVLPDSSTETRAILRQLAPTLPDQEGVLEIALFPKGLGQVRLDIQHGPMGARIIVSADRPETIDLIRRHAADLVAEFRTAGMANPVVSFAPVDASPTIPPAQRLDATGLLTGGGSFGGSSQHTGGSPQSQPPPRPDTPPAANLPNPTPPPFRSDVVPSGGLILRL